MLESGHVLQRIAIDGDDVGRAGSARGVTRRRDPPARAANSARSPLAGGGLGGIAGNIPKIWVDSLLNLVS